MMKLLKPLFLVASCLLGFQLSAQSVREYILEDKDRSAGFYHSYEAPLAPASVKARPKGYKPFYISHYGRHGSRWNSSRLRYEGTLAFLQTGDSLGVLTDLGKRFMNDLRVVAADAAGRWGDLSPRGVREHKGIARRMYSAYPEVFRKGAVVDSRSSIYVRCVLSMAAFNEALKEQEPELVMIREASKKQMDILCPPKEDQGYGPELVALADSLRHAWISTEPFMNRLFTDGGAFLQGKITDEQSFLYDCFEMAGIMQCCDYLGLDLYYIFTDDEIFSLWKYLNGYGYSLFGPVLKYGDAYLESAKVLLKDFIEKADAVIDGKEKVAATLRFGHDANIIPLISLMGLECSAARVEAKDAAEHWNITEVSPMAANLQLIFFRNRKNEVKVRVLYNEKDAVLPLAGAPFYDWTVLRPYLVSKCQ